MTCRLKLLLCTGLGLLVFLAVTSPAKADLVGTSVTGSVVFDGEGVNCFDPAAGCAGAPPAGDLNTVGTTVTISATATEFGYTDFANADAADFTGTALTVTDNVLTGAFNWVMTFTDTSFAGLNLVQTADTFTNGGVTGVLTGDTITLNWAGTGTQDGPLSTTFTLTPAPEPSTLLLLSVGVAGLIGLAYRR